MLNMGLKTAEICDVDNRIKKRVDHSIRDSISDGGSDGDLRSVSAESFTMNEMIESNKRSFYSLLNPKNYPFY